MKITVIEFASEAERIAWSKLLPVAKPVTRQEVAQKRREGQKMRDAYKRKLRKQ